MTPRESGTDQNTVPFVPSLSLSSVHDSADDNREALGLR